jgi:CRP/FNR family transcriptional regulator, cyclic AMP receptor protein
MIRESRPPILFPAIHPTTGNEVGDRQLNPSSRVSGQGSPDSSAPSSVASFFLLRDTESATERLAKLSSTVRLYPRGAVIYRQGESAAHFYQLLSGRVRIYIAMASGTERVLSYAEPGSTFGESACFDEKPYYTTAVAVRLSQVRVVARDAVLRAARDTPEVLGDIFRALVRKQRQLAMHVAADRLCARDRATLLLNSMVEVYGDSVAGSRGVRLHLGLSIEELASMVGVTRVTMSRELSGLVRRGTLAKEGLDIIVLDPGALRKAASQLGV